MVCVHAAPGLGGGLERLWRQSCGPCRGWRCCVMDHLSGEVEKPAVPCFALAGRWRVKVQLICPVTGCGGCCWWLVLCRRIGVWHWLAAVSTVSRCSAGGVRCETFGCPIESVEVSQKIKITKLYLFQQVVFSRNRIEMLDSCHTPVP